MQSKPVAVLALLLLSLLGMMHPAAMATPGGLFNIVSYSFVSRSGGPVYPGSNAVLTVSIEYTGSTPLDQVTVCITLPEGFNLAPGEPPCKPPEISAAGPGNTTIVNGTVLSVEYDLKVLSSTSPGVYTFTLGVRYIAPSLQGEEKLYLQATVNSLPPPGLVVVDAYWEPAGYPGSQGVTLALLVENKGEADISGGRLRVEFPEDTISPSVVYVDLPFIPSGSSTVLRIPGLSISPSASPGAYTASYSVDASLSVDGVDYTGTRIDYFTFTIAPPPRVVLKLVDYGLAPGEASIRGSSGQSIYVILSNMQPGTVIDSVYAWFSIEQGGFFGNGSRVGFTYSNTVIDYGSALALESPRLAVIEDSELRIKLRLLFHGSVNGAEFWSEDEYVFTISLREPEDPLHVVAVYWSNGHVYPGSADEALVVKLVNRGLAQVSSLTAELTLPEGFSPEKIYSSAQAVAPGSTATLVFDGVDVDASIKPGSYNATLRIVAELIYNGARYNVTLNKTILVKVHDPGEEVFELAYAGWGSGIGYPDMIGASIRAELRVREPVDVESISAWLESLPPGVSARRGARVVEATVHTYGDIVVLEFEGFDVHAKPNTTLPLALRIQALVSRGGSEYWLNTSIPLLLRVSEASRVLSLIDYGFVGVGPFEEAYGVRPYLTFFSNTSSGVVDWVYLSIVVSGGVFEDNRSRIILGYDASIQPGGSATLELPGLARVYGPVRLAVNATIMLRLSDGSLAVIRQEHIVVLGPAEAYEPLVVASTATLYNGQPVLVYPGQRSVELRLVLLNTLPRPLSSITLEASVPHGFNLSSVSGSCLAGVAAGSTCSVSLVFDVSDSVRPGQYNVTLVIGYTYTSGGAVYRGSVHKRVPLLVHDVRVYGPRIEVAAVRWATSTGRVYAFSGVYELDVVLVNRGREAAYGVVGRVVRVQDGLEPVVDSSTCSQALPPGGFCTLRYTFSLETAPPKRYSVELNITYQRLDSGLNVLMESEKSISVAVDPPPRGVGLRLVDSGWLNSWPVYPGTSSATYVVTIASSWAYQVAGVHARLALPWGEEVEAYYDGPLQPYGSTTLEFSVDVPGATRPGSYYAELEVSYVVLAPGTTVEHVDKYRVRLNVSSPKEAFSIVTAQWRSEAPGKGSVGAVLRIVLRNNELPSARGLVAILESSEGVVFTVNNESRAKIPLTPLESVNVEELLKAINAQVPLARPTGSGGGAQEASITGKGSLFYVDAPLTIYTNTSRINVSVSVEFTDPWGSTHTAGPYTVEVLVPGRVTGFNVSITPQRATPINGTVEARLVIVNSGGSPALDAEVIVVPKVAIVLPLEPRLHLDSISPGSPVVLPVVFSYNPAGVQVYGGEAPRYMAVPVLVTIMYRDLLGNFYTYNSTVTLTLEPPIDVGLIDAKAELQGSRLLVGGTIVNRGLAVARSVEVVVHAGGTRASSFLGDLDPASQTAFRIDLDVRENVGEVVIEVRYLDDYGVKWTRTEKLPVRVATASTATTLPGEEAVAGYREYFGAVVAAVIVFLAAVFILVRRHLKRTIVEGVGEA